jgi:glycine cleavage system H lipoate-binding protein
MDDHFVVSIDGYACDRCGRLVNGQTDEDGRPTIEGDSVRHLEEAS